MPRLRTEVARQGGLAISKNKAHMAEIGRKGGLSVSKDRAHMSRIGKLSAMKRPKKVLPPEPSVRTHKSFYQKGPHCGDLRIGEKVTGMWKNVDCHGCLACLSKGRRRQAKDRKLKAAQEREKLYD